MFHSLYQISKMFKQSLAAVLKSGQFGKHPFELMAVPIPVTPWIGPPTEEHPYDRNRSEYSILFTEIEYVNFDNTRLYNSCSRLLTISISFTGTLRDWNEEYQGCKELPKSTVQER